MIDKNSIIERLDILHEANIISPTVREKSELVVNRFLDISDDLAIALSRVEKGECESGIDDNVVTEIKQNGNYNEASKILDDIEGLFQVEIPEGEKILLLIHICNLLER